MQILTAANFSEAEVLSIMTDRDLVFGPARTADSPAITELLGACGLPADDIGEHIAGLVTVRSEGTIIATIGLESYGRVALLRSLAVTPAWRGHGIAAELCRRIEARARANGVRELFLLTTTAAGFFEDRGWHRADRGQAPAAIRATSEFSSLCPASATFMTRRLDDRANGA
jgi:amino-acid N-acetyltransferase